MGLLGATFIEAHGISATQLISAKWIRISISAIGAIGENIVPESKINNIAAAIVGVIIRLTKMPTAENIPK